MVYAKEEAGAILLSQVDRSEYLAKHSDEMFNLNNSKGNGFLLSTQGDISMQDGLLSNLFLFSG